MICTNQQKNLPVPLYWVDSSVHLPGTDLAVVDADFWVDILTSLETKRIEKLKLMLTLKE